MFKYYTNYQNSIVNVSNSILKYYEIPSMHATLPALDTVLNKKYKNVVLFVFDGMGYHNIKTHLNKFGFIQQHITSVISSVFPPTTVAATTSILSGLVPAEHGWLGWDTYIKDIDAVVTMFYDQIKNSNTSLENISCYSLFPYQPITSKIQSTAKIETHIVSPFVGNMYAEDDQEAMFNKIAQVCRNESRNFVYAYNVQPDQMMHIEGATSEKVGDIMCQIEARLKQFSTAVDDTLCIVLADHGHITIDSYIYLEDYPELFALLTKPTSSEARATHLFVDKQNHKQFKKLFTTSFKDDFYLMDKQEMITSGIYGSTSIPPYITQTLGDFMAIALKHQLLLDKRPSDEYKGHHAGGLKEEDEIALITFTCKL